MFFSKHIWLPVFFKINMFQTSFEKCRLNVRPSRLHTAASQVGRSFFVFHDVLVEAAMNKGSPFPMTAAPAESVQINMTWLEVSQPHTIVLSPDIYVEWHHTPPTLSSPSTNPNLHSFCS
jgi:hypothetical protein